MTQFPIKRKDLPPGESLCSYCTALCCRYFALPLDTPTTWEDFDNIRWFMMHGRVSVFVDDKTWYICIEADCRHLLPDHRCGIYDDRPRICRGYHTNDCEYDNPTKHELSFDTPEQLWEYAQKVMTRKAARRATSSKNGKAAVKSKSRAAATSSKRRRIPVVRRIPRQVQSPQQNGLLPILN